MPQIRPALAALLAASAALIVLLLACAPASAEDLSSKLEDKEAKLSDVREREGVLTTTISHYRDRIERLTDEVAVLRGQEAAVKQRLDAKQAELDAAVDELDVAKKHLAVVRGRLQRALVALRERLIAIYENGTPDMLSVIVGADGYDELIDQSEYLERIHGHGRSRGRAGPPAPRPGAGNGLATALGEAADRIGPRRDRRRTPGPGHARSAVQQRQSKLVEARRDREAVLSKINDHEQKIEGSVAEIQAEIAAQLGASSSSARCRRVRSGTARAS